MVLTPEITTSPASISISAILELRVCVMPGETGLRSGQNQRDGSRRIGQIGAFQLESRVGAPHADVGLVLGCRLLTVRDQLRWRVRGLAPRTWRKSVRLAVLASATVK